MSSQLSEADIRGLIQDVVDPEIGRTLGALGMIGSIAATGDGVYIGVELPTPAYPERERIGRAIEAAVHARDPQAGPVSVEYSSVVRGKNSGGSIGLNVKNVIAVGSGKGGVGKSTIAASLAFGLQHCGAKVGLLDADVYGPSIPHLIGATGEPTVTEIALPDGRVTQRLVPIDVQGVKVVSVGFQVAEDQAIVWRGPMLHKQLTVFLQHTGWGDLDYLIVDMPPGTGDVALSLSQMMQVAGAVVVCTPQKVALLDAMKAISMFRTVKIPVLGMVENMSGDLFGRGGTRAKAQQLGVPFLGEVPSDPFVRIAGDDGRIASIYEEENASRDPLLFVCRRTAVELAKTLLETPTMPSLELL